MPRHGWLVSYTIQGREYPLAFFPHFGGTTTETTNWAACARFIYTYQHPYYATARYIEECN